MKSLALVALLVAPAVAGAPLAAAADSPPPPAPPNPHTYTAPADPDAVSTTDDAASPARSARQLRNAQQSTRVRCVAPSRTPVVDGQPITVSLPPAKAFTVGSLRGKDWANPPVTDPSWRLGWYSFRWLTPLLQRAVDDGQTRSVAVMLDQVLRFYREYPDPGKAVVGWDEGNSLRRLENLNCMYALTRDARLVTAMRVEANVLFGPRYYGPPYRPVHNHGLMANVRLIEAGKLLGRADWIDRASARIRSELGQSFTRSGTSYEQSATYQGVNTDLWAAAANTLEGLAAPGVTDPTVRAIREVAARARGVAQWLTEPDGNWVQIGDSTKTPGKAAPQGATGRSFRDDQAGLAVGRWSWADPNTTYYTLRYGPPRFAHGHPDKGAVTWTTSGTRVLVGSGYFGYDSTSPFVRWQQTPDSSNVAFPVGAQMNRNSMTVARSTIRGSRHNWRLTSKVYPRTHNRYVDVNHHGRILTVTDNFTGRGAADQMWHLDPAWQLVSAPRGAKTARFAHPSGRTLTIRTDGVLASAKRGATNPVAGWNFAKPGSRTPAWELRIRWNSGTVKTTFTVR